MANKPAPDIDGDVASRMPQSPPGGIPGRRAALAEGALPKPYLGPQGDEQRDPPAGSPAPVPQAPVVVGEDIRGLPYGTVTEKTDDDAAVPPSPSLGSVGPESEVRGGAEAPSDSDILDTCSIIGEA